MDLDKEVKAFGMRLVKALGIDTHAECDKRKGIVHVRDSEDGWRPLAYTDEEHTNPLVSKCNHDGLEMILEFIEAISPKFIEYKLAGGNGSFPSPEDFSFVYLEDMESDEEISPTADVLDLINKVKAKA
jgi:hypothetical protein